MQNIIAAITNKEVRNKILFTLLAFLVYKLATMITVPLIDTANLANTILGDENGALGIVNAFTGNALKQFSIIALGISPYITASIIVQLLQMDIFPLLKEWSEEGETGKQKINQLTRYLAIGMAFAQALVLALGIGDVLFIKAEYANFFGYVYIAVVVTGGTAFLLWLADQITLRGIGNGTSMLIVAGIVSGLPSMFVSIWEQYITNGENLFDYSKFGIIVIVYILIILFVTFIQISARKIPIQYANRPASAKFQGRSDSNIPIKINSSGVIPVIFAVTLLGLGQYILTATGWINGLITVGWITSFIDWCEVILVEVFDYTTPFGYFIYVILVFTFAFFYAFVQINPEKIAKNLQDQKAYIPGVRPGVETENYISRTLFRVTMVGALFLIFVASLPIFITMIFTDMPSSVQIGGTSLLIVVGVAIETTKQIKTQTQEQTYSGFIK